MSEYSILDMYAMIPVVDMDEERMGSFDNDENMEKFMGSELGLAQIDMIKDMADDLRLEDPTSEQIVDFLRQTQQQQATEEGSIDILKVSDKEVLDGHSWLEKKFDDDPNGVTYGPSSFATEETEKPEEPEEKAEEEYFYKPEIDAMKDHNKDLEEVMKMDM